jgi:ABC-type cobalamin/Fe3+-siderophores transport system ATPase subunit
MLNRGSEWHKWDLHVHTPESELNNQFPSDWDAYVKALFSKAIEKEISVIGITDYYSIDGYKKLKNEYLNNSPKMRGMFSDEEIDKINKILLLPNIEFRLKTIVSGNPKDLDKLNRKLNYHVIFSDKVSIEDIEDSFLTQLSFNFDANTGRTVQERSLTKSNLKSLGERLKKQQAEFQKHSDIFIGKVNASVCEQKIAELLDNDLFLNMAVMGVNPDEDLSKVSWVSGGHNTRKNLIKQAHFMFTSNPGSIKFISGEFHDCITNFKSEFKEIKPCLWGSDAHSIDSLFEPDDSRYTWIKSNLSFGGLKQVIYDPLSRVYIGKLSPDNKSNYQTIKRARFIDNRESPEFSNEWIPFSKDLTTIIGGKSSGKSLLLHHIAKTINYNHVSINCKIAKASLYEQYNQGFEVEWSNGVVSKLSDISSESCMPITYIPQLYINQLAESDGKAKLDNLVKDILSQNINFKKEIDGFEKSISEINRKITECIGIRFMYKKQYSQAKENVSKIGVRTAIENEISLLMKENEFLQKASGFSQSEFDEYSGLRRKILILSERKSAFESIQTSAVNYISVSNNYRKELIEGCGQKILQDVQISSDSTFIKNILDVLAEGVTNAFDLAENHAAKRISHIPSKLASVNLKISVCENKIEPYLKKVKDQERLLQVQAKLKFEEKNLQNIIREEEKLKSIMAQGKLASFKIIDEFNKLIEAYKLMSKEVAQDSYKIDDDITLSAKVVFNADRFDEFVSCFDRRGDIKGLLNGFSNNLGGYDFDVDEHVKVIEGIFNNIKSPAVFVTTKKGISEEEVIKRLFSDCYDISYLVNYHSDEIVTMSPGKRGLVLLNLILHISNSSHPIFIDQPEDNLDNRTIYEQLIGFVRSKKQNRQIIMVTHNANLVVAADSEMVIVANQDGQNVGQENETYKFEYCSGAIETSFNSPGEKGLLRQKGIRQHICEILEGGVIAFREREKKYGLAY